MKYEYFEDKIIVYVYKDIDIKTILTEIFNKLIDDNNLYSEYSVIIYCNKYYGIIIDVENLTNKKVSEKVQIKLNIVKDKLFLYEVEDPLYYDYKEAYYYDNKFYISIEEKNIKLLEYAKIIYDDFVYKILGRGIKV